MLHRLVPVAAVLVAALLPAQTAPSETPSAWMAGQLPELEALYRHLHQNPELSFREQATSARMVEELQRAGIPRIERIGGGVVGVLANGEGPIGLLRADMDALPVAEQTGLAYASTVRGTSADGQPVGVMHACGHDLHMTCLVGAARWFAAHRTDWHGTLLFVFQPAEERVGGAKAMLAAGLYDKCGRPAFALALHTAADLAADKIGFRVGATLANVDSCDITVFGRGGHGASPHLTIDPIVMAAQLVLDLQTVVSREIDPVEPCVLTVGSIHGGHKHNIIDDHCSLQLTLRSYTPKVREQLKSAIVRKAEAVAVSYRAPAPKVEFSEPADALLNEAGLTSVVVAACRTALGAERVVEVPPAMGAEDFGRFGADGIPVCMLRLGTVEAARLQAMQQQGAVPALHSGLYAPDAAASMRTGVPALVAATLAALAR